MKEKKSFFGGLRRGNKPKGTSDAVTADTKPTDEKPTDDVSTIEDTARTPDTEAPLPETDDSDNESDETRISDHTRPNETLGNLLSDIQRIHSEKEENTGDSPPEVPPDTSSTVSDTEPGEQGITLNDIISGIQKNKTYRDLTHDEEKPEHEPETPVSMLHVDTNAETNTDAEIDTEYTHQTPDEGQIPQPQSEETPDSTTDREAESKISSNPPDEPVSSGSDEQEAKNTGESDIQELIEELSRQVSSGEEENPAAVPSPTDHPVVSAPDTTEEEQIHKTPDSTPNPDASHLDSLIAELQQQTTDSGDQDLLTEPDSFQEHKIDAIIRELSHHKEEIPQGGYDDEEREYPVSGDISSIIQEIQNSEEGNTVKTSLNDRDELIDELVTSYDETKQVPEKKPTHNSTTKITQIIEEVSDKGVKSIRKENIEIKPEADNSHSESRFRKKRNSGGIISAEEAANFSDLIMSGGAELDLEDFHISQEGRNFEMKSRSEIIAALDDIVESDLDNLDI
jgi:hypothetical protein